MSKKKAEVEVHAQSNELMDLRMKDLDVSVDFIDDGLYLGNLACARDTKTLESLRITHILTIDSVPLPLAILDRPNLTFKFVKLNDVPKEDLITKLPTTNALIKQAIDSGGTVLVHCFYGVSRSAAVVVSYIMEKYQLCYNDALELVRSKRKFAHPNMGFEAQLKLFGHMGYKLDKDDPRFKQFRLKMAGQKLKQVKILPQQFADLIKPDPGLIRERPDPIVYRCMKCRRVVAGQSNIIPHIPKQLKIELAKKGIRPPPSKLTGLNCAENGQILISKLKSLASEIMKTTGTGCSAGNATTSTESGAGNASTSTESDAGNASTSTESGAGNASTGTESGAGNATASTSSSDSPGQGHSQCDDANQNANFLDGYSEQNLVDAAIVGPSNTSEVCRLMWFVEPMSWMEGVSNGPSGKLHCPKCRTKLGSFSWLMGCKCPCGQKVAPAFYLVPSKVEWSNIVQNVQITV